MAVQGFGAGDFAAIAKCAWKIYDNVRESRANFGKLNIDVECLLVSIGSLDKGHTQSLIADYIDCDEEETRQHEVRALRDGLNSVIMPFYALFDANTVTFDTSDSSKSIRPIDNGPIIKYVGGSSNDHKYSRPKERPWRRWPATSWIQRLVVSFELKDMSELRSRFAVQAANLNLFMTRLTHIQLQKQTELLTLRLSEQSLLRDNFHYSLALAEATDEFRQDVASYIRFLIDGGKPFADGELQQRKIDTRYLHHSRRKSSRTRPEVELRAEMEYHKKGHARKYERHHEPTSDDTFLLDDDARLKLESARERLAIAELRVDQGDQSLEVTWDDTSIKGKSSALVHIKPEPGEKIALPRRRASHSHSPTTAAYECDVCERGIEAEKSFYRCSSGRCGDKDDTFDVCRRCFAEGKTCPGFRKGVCHEMEKVRWKEAD